MTQLAIVADDLTGAADSAGVFVAAGLSTVIPLRAGPLPVADVISVSTDSRDIPEPDAVDAVRRAVGRLCATSRPPGLIYKKLDSALRGHLRAELLATMDALGSRRAAVCPALPAEGRTTVGGRQHVHGVPLDRSAFGGPGVNSDVCALLSGEVGAPVHHIGLDGLRAGVSADAMFGDGLYVFDAESAADLDLVAGAALSADIRVAAGSAGLALALARRVRSRSEAAAPPWRPANGRPIFMIVGSRHDASARQIAHAEATGIRVVSPEQRCLDCDGAPLGDALAAVEAELNHGRDVILTSLGLQRSPLGAFAVADRLASALESERVLGAIGGLVLTGGDVAAAACRALGADALWLRGEAQPALPWSTISGGRLSGLPVVTKAGSFGGDDALIAAGRLLSRART